MWWRRRDQTLSKEQRGRRWRRRLTVAVVTLGFVFIGIGGGCADWLVMGWSKAPLTPPPVLRREAMRRNDGGLVECFVVRSPGARDREPEGYVLFFVGKMDRAERWLEAVAGAWGDRPVEVWGMNYPGSGGTDGPVKMSLVVPSALAEYDVVSARAAGRPILAHAASFGTTPALALAARRPMAGLVIQKPPALRQIVLREYGWWNLWLLAGLVAAQIPSDLDSVKNAKRATAPCVFVLPGADQVVPPKYQRLIADAYAGPKCQIPIPGAGHDDPLTKEASQQLGEAMDWMWERAKTGPR